MLRPYSGLRGLSTRTRRVEGRGLLSRDRSGGCLFRSVPTPTVQGWSSDGDPGSYRRDRVRVDVRCRRPRSLSRTGLAVSPWFGRGVGAPGRRVPGGPGRTFPRAGTCGGVLCLLLPSPVLPLLCRTAGERHGWRVGFRGSGSGHPVSTVSLRWSPARADSEGRRSLACPESHPMYRSTSVVRGTGGAGFEWGGGRGDVDPRLSPGLRRGTSSFLPRPGGNSVTSPSSLRPPPSFPLRPQPPDGRHPCPSSRHGSPGTAKGRCTEQGGGGPRSSWGECSRRDVSLRSLSNTALAYTALIALGVELPPPTPSGPPSNPFFSVCGGGGGVRVSPGGFL